MAPDAIDEALVAAIRLPRIDIAADETAREITIEELDRTIVGGADSLSAFAADIPWVFTVRSDGYPAERAPLLRDHPLSFAGERARSPVRCNAMLDLVLNRAAFASSGRTSWVRPLEASGCPATPREAGTRRR
jgi:hypothetical protein